MALASIIEDGRGQSIHFRLLHFVPGFFSGILSSSTTPPCDYKYMYNCICTQREAGKGVLETIYWRTFTLCMGPNSKSTKLLDHPYYKSLGGLRASEKYTAVQSPLPGYFFSIAFFEPCPSTESRQLLYNVQTTHDLT